MHRRFAPFHPTEPRPALPPELRPGVLVAPYTATMVRLGPWVPARIDGGGYLVAIWRAPDDDVWMPAHAVVWDGANPDRHTVLPLPTGVAVCGSDLTITLGATPWRTYQPGVWD